jgi:hypothetical protein
MAQYYQNRPSTTTTTTQQPHGEDHPDQRDDAPVVSEFDKLRETLRTDDLEEGWASELRRYFGTMQRDVSKDTDLVEWWQVLPSQLQLDLHVLTSSIRTTHSCFQHSHGLQLMSCQLRLHLFRVRGCSLAPNKLQLTDVHP